MKSLLVIIIIISVLFIQSCSKDSLSPAEDIPVNYSPVKTLEITYITDSSAVCGGNISYVANLNVRERGVCWSTSQNPTISDCKTATGAGKGEYACILTGLNPVTTYYLRAYALIESGAVYGAQVTFTTKPGKAPKAPTLLFPYNGAKFQNIELTFRWNNIGKAENYSLQISDNKSFSSYVYNIKGLKGNYRQISGLKSYRTYYWRVNARNSQGASEWSSVWAIKTGIGGPIGSITVQYSGKTYNSVQIGSQIWLMENIDVGTMIPGSQIQMDNGTIEKYCYNNDPVNCDIYGGLYQWNEAMAYNKFPATKGICPEGWHLPTWEELLTLSEYVDNNSNELKATGQGIASGEGNNYSGFSALLAGFNRMSSFYYLGYNALFWSSTEFMNNSYFLGLNYINSSISVDTRIKTEGLSVRCIKD